MGVAINGSNVMRNPGWYLTATDIVAIAGFNVDIDGVVNIGGGAVTSARVSQPFELHVSADFGGMSLNTWSATTAQNALLDFNRSKSAIIGTHTAVAAGDNLGTIMWRGADGSAPFVDAANMRGEVDGSVSSNVVPGRITWTTANSAGTSTQRMRLASAGSLLIGHDSATSTNLMSATNMVRLGQPLGIATTSNYGGLGVTTFSATNGERALIDIKKSANAALGNISTDVAASEGLGVIVFRGTAGSTYVTAAEIQADVSGAGTISSSSMPGRLAFRVTADGATGGTEYMSIESDGGITMAGLLESGSAGNAVHRNTSTNEIFEYTSSARFKNDIRSLDATDSDIVRQLRAKRYQPKDSRGGEYEEQYGLIAEEVYKVAPALVNLRRLSTLQKDDKGQMVSVPKGNPVPYGVRYEALSVLLLGKVQELQARLVALEGEADV